MRERRPKAKVPEPNPPRGLAAIVSVTETTRRGLREMEEALPKMAAPSQLALPALCSTIKTLIEKGDRAREKSEQFYIAAGQHLAELKARAPRGEFDRMAMEDCGVGRSRAYELLAIGKGKTTVAEVRERVAGVMQKVRANRPTRVGRIEAPAPIKAATPPPISPPPTRALAVQPQASDPIQEECTDCNSAAEHWQRSLGNIAGDAVSIRAYWTREFGPWESFEVPSSLGTLAKQAAEVWNQLALQLEDRARSARARRSMH